MEESKSVVKDRRALMQYVEMLRFGPKEYRREGTVHMTQQQIAKLTGCSTTHVASLLAEARGMKKPKHTARRGRRTKLKVEHVTFLVERDTLQKWAAKTLVERTKLFHRQFPE